MVCNVCYFFFSAFFLLLLDHSIYAWSIRRVLEDARGREAVVVVVAVRDNHKRIRGCLYSGFFFNSFLNLVKRFRVRLCNFSGKRFLFFVSLFFSYDSGHVDIRLTHDEIYYEYNDLDTLQMPTTWACDVALEHRRNRRDATSDDIGVGDLNRSCDGTDSEPRQRMVGALNFYRLPAAV